MILMGYSWLRTLTWIPEVREPVITFLSDGYTTLHFHCNAMQPFTYYI